MTHLRLPYRRELSDCRGREGFPRSEQQAPWECQLLVAYWPLVYFQYRVDPQRAVRLWAVPQRVVPQPAVHPAPRWVGVDRLGFPGDRQRKRLLQVEALTCRKQYFGNGRGHSYNLYLLNKILVKMLYVWSTLHGSTSGIKLDQKWVNNSHFNIMDIGSNNTFSNQELTRYIWCKTSLKHWELCSSPDSYDRQV